MTLEARLSTCNLKRRFWMYGFDRPIGRCRSPKAASFRGLLKRQCHISKAIRRLLKSRSDHMPACDLIFSGHER